MPPTKADPRSDLNKVLADLNKRLGDGMIHRANESPPVYHLPFSSPHLNYATEGGAPWNRIISLMGDESTGKSLALYLLYATAQALPHSMDDLWRARIEYHRGHGHAKVVEQLQDELDWVHDNFPDGAECCHYDIEGQFDKRRAAKVGVDIDRLYLSESNEIENVCGTLSALFGKIHVHGLDSTSQATSLLRLKQEPGKSLVGTDARQWKNSLRDALTYFGPVKNGSGIPNMLVMIHQMSMNVNTGAPEQATGKFMRFISSCSVQFTRGAFLWKKDGVLYDDKARAFGSAKGADEASMAGKAEADGVEVYAKITKSRTCRPNRAAGMQFDYHTLRHVTVSELASSGLYYGIIVKSGSHYRVDGEDKTIGQGLRPVYERLASDEELRNCITARLLDFSDEEADLDMIAAMKERTAEQEREQVDAALAADYDKLSTALDEVNRPSVNVFETA